MTQVFRAKAWLGGMGLVLGLAGMASERRGLVWGAVLLLGAAFLVRVMERNRPTRGSPMLPLRDARWAQLRHAYGPASDIPDYLTQARSDFTLGTNSESAWFKLWSALCHQDDVYTASYAAVPHLVAIARARAVGGQYEPITLGGSIELARLEGRGPPLPDDLAEPYQAAVAELRILAQDASAQAGDPDARRAFAGSLAALRGDVAAARAAFDADLRERPSGGAA
jgi:hypothetical protein